MSLHSSEFPAGAAARPAPLAARAVERAWRSVTLTRAVSLAVFAAVAAFILLTFRDYGISNDELVQHTYGELLIAWYASGFTDDRAFHYINLFLYGGLFDMIAAGLQNHIPIPVYEWRHLLSAGFGFMGLIGVWRLGKLLGGEKAGIVALLLLAFTGMYGGAMFTHTKDVPFAAAMVWSLYFITVLVARLPDLPSWRVIVGLGAAVGCALGLRVGGVFAVFYLLVTVGAGALVFRSVWLPFRLLPRLIVSGLVALAIMAVTWPWSMLPPSNLFKAMGAFNNFSFDLSTLFNGQLVPIDKIPSTYMTEYLLIKLPELTLFGILMALVAAAFSLMRLLRQGAVVEATALHPRRLVAFLPLLLAIGTPIVFTLLDGPPLYNGIRHFLFVIPPVTVLAALGLTAGWRLLWPRSRALGLGFAAVVTALFALNAVSLIRLHPYEYVAYNQLVGGTPGAWGRFEGDYWSSSLREAALDLRKGLDHEEAIAAVHTPHRYKVAVCAEDLQVSSYLGPNVDMVDDWDEADFLLTATNIGCDGAKGMPYATVSRMGIPFATVTDLRAGHKPVGQELPADEDGDDDIFAPSPNAPLVSSLKDAGPQVAKAKP
ncbi:hypothetical protein FHS55_003832 [Angulomicrobium tetraedrale]|uniref:Glycosyltransferase RgtA/B/C/D-like domain-containing protein n=1 Tax=Ancylobacter tetraedralis TaxID=217068 RepID=A0A839ZEF2_9HYPH|nr:hypothetical protein [Ancylobacter tetraedralis]MBB3773201.1 hypothetical protein [Ancylobacter tetraedralis]